MIAKGQSERHAFVPLTSEPAPGPAPAPDMIWIDGRTFRMGSDEHYPEERPAHDVYVDGFWIDRYPVTNARFAAFIQATGHITGAEIARHHPLDDTTTAPGLLHPVSLVFMKPAGFVDTRNHFNWWHHVHGADWRHPQGPASSIDDLQHHPVVHVTFGDAERFAAWEGKSLPTEAEWEMAARGGLEGALYAWGDALTPDNRYMANTWQGEFPWQNFADDGFDGTSPVSAFPPNGYGVFDMIGNVWEWTCDWFNSRHPVNAAASGIPSNPRGGREDASYDPSEPAARIPRRVLKGGSHLCAPNYCRRYRPAARAPQAIDASASDIGFRCIVRPPAR